MCVCTWVYMSKHPDLRQYTKVSFSTLNPAEDCTRNRKGGDTMKTYVFRACFIKRYTFKLLQRLERFRLVVEAVDPELAATMEWHRATLFMEPRPGVMAIFMYQGGPGAFRVLIKTEQRKTGRFLCNLF